MKRIKMFAHNYPLTGRPAQVLSAPIGGSPGSIGSAMSLSQAVAKGGSPKSCTGIYLDANRKVCELLTGETPRPNERSSTKLPCVELDSIVMRCLETDPARRYPTAEELALDFEHFLNDEPVKAHPPSTWNRIREFIRRNWRKWFDRAAVFALS
jgi:serine/threonine protein kinase